jgi:hypothetical protein
MRDCHPNTEDPKVVRLEALYHAAGRDNPSHPMHGLYTGLHQEDLNRRIHLLNEQPAA